MEEVVVFVLSVAVAVALLSTAAVAHATLTDAAQKAYEYAQVRAAWPVMFPAGDASVHLCVNTTYPVFVLKNGQFVEAKEATLFKAGKKWHAVPGRGRDGVLCMRYLGEYRVGDSVAYQVAGQYAAYYRNITIAAAPPRG